MVNSGFLNDMEVYEAIPAMMDHLEKKGWGEKSINYHLRDWLISRQRYWGPPIPMVYCGKCAEKGDSWFSLQGDSFKGLHDDQSDWEDAGWFPEEKLPVELPRLEEFKPRGGGTGPLDDHPEFYKTKCPHCGGEAKRETDVSDTFLDSSWYFLGYPMQNTEVWDGDEVLRQVRTSQGSNSAQDDKSGLKSLPDLSSKEAPLLQNKIIESWLPVNLYFGGAEHAVLHLMYARFVTMLLNDLKYIDFEEPFPRFYAHGLMIKDGAKMSKSKGNVVNPDEYIEKYGADTLRLYLMFMGPMDGYPDFRDTGIEGMRRFVDRVWDLYQNHADIAFVDEDINTSLNIKIHQTIKKVTEDVERFQYNTSIAAIMELVNLMRDMALDEGAERVEYSRHPEGDTGVTREEPEGSQPKKREEVLRSVQNDKFNVWQDALKTLALLLAPFAPHMAEEAWNSVLGQKFSIHTHPWPVYNKQVIREEQVEIIVQVDGRTRATIEMDREESMQKELIVEAAKGDQNVSKWIEGEQIKETIFVPGRLVNFVIS